MMVDGHCPFEIVILWEPHIFRHTRLDVQNHGFLKLIPYSPAMVLKTWKYGKNMPTTVFDFPIKNGGSFHSYVTVYQRFTRG